MEKEKVTIVDAAECKNDSAKEVKISRKKVLLGNDKKDVLKLSERADVANMDKKLIAAELKELETIAIEQTTQLGETEYPIKIDTEGYLKELIKFVEKDLPWSHRNATLLVSLHSELKAAKQIGIDKDGMIWILGKDIAHLYNSLAQRAGTGYFSARNHVRLVTIIGETVSEAMKMVADDNSILREIHTRLAELDTRKQAIDVEDCGVESENIDAVKATAAKLDESKVAAGEILKGVESIEKD
jgi:hypothetical protein